MEFSEVHGEMERVLAQAVGGWVLHKVKKNYLEAVTTFMASLLGKASIWGVCSGVCERCKG